MYDVIVIGAGVSGSATARELSRYDLKVGVLEKEEDVCCGTSKANSGIVHAGFDARPGSLMAKMNVRGNQMMEQLTEDLDIPFGRNGSLVLCFAKDEMERLEKLKKQGEENGVKRLQILSGEEVRRMEPDLSKEVYAALYAPTGGIVCPFELNLALAENACQNGAEFYFDTVVEQIEKTEGGYRIHAGEKTYETRCVVNAAGVYADVFHNMVSEKKIRITPRKGEYYLLDKKAGTTVHHTIFQIPGAYGKGVLVTPTTHGNLLVGPTAVDIEKKEGTNTTKTGLDEVAQKAVRSVPNLPLRQVITSFAGLRAHEDGHEFIIREVEDAEGFFDCAGIESPGLTSAPAIGELVAELVTGYLCAKKKQHFEEKRKGLVNPKNLSREAYQELIRENPAYGNVICRCETVTEGGIMNYPFENDTERIEKRIAEKSVFSEKNRTFLIRVIILIAAFLLSFSGILLCNATLSTQQIAHVNNTTEAVGTVLGIVIVLLCTAGLAVKNILYVSVLQRVHEFAQLRAIGATYQQIKSVVKKERDKIAKPCIVLGTVIGFLVNIVLPLHFYWIPSIVCAVISGIFIWIITALAFQAPAKMAASTSPIEAQHTQATNYFRSVGAKRKLTPIRIGWMYCRANRKKAAYTFLSLIMSGILMFGVFSILNAINPERLASQPYQGNSDVFVLLNSTADEESTYDLMKSTPFTEEKKQKLYNISGVKDVYELYIRIPQFKEKFFY